MVSTTPVYTLRDAPPTNNASLNHTWLRSTPPKLRFTAVMVPPGTRLCLRSSQSRRSRSSRRNSWASCTHTQSQRGYDSGCEHEWQRTTAITLEAPRTCCRKPAKPGSMRRTQLCNAAGRMDLARVAGLPVRVAPVAGAGDRGRGASSLITVPTSGLIHRSSADRAAMRTARCRLVRGATATVAEPALASPGGGATKVFKSASKAARKGIAALWQQPRAKKGGYGDIWGAYLCVIRVTYPSACKVAFMKHVLPRFPECKQQREAVGGWTTTIVVGLLTDAGPLSRRRR